MSGELAGAGSGAASGAMLGSFLGPIGTAVGAVAGGAAGFFMGKAQMENQHPTLKSPTSLSQQPSQGEAADKAAKKNLDEEQNVASASAYLSGGAGLTTTPATRASSLLGY